MPSVKSEPFSIYTFKERFHLYASCVRLLLFAYKFITLQYMVAIFITEIVDVLKIFECINDITS